MYGGGLFRTFLCSILALNCPVSAITPASNVQGVDQKGSPRLVLRLTAGTLTSPPPDEGRKDSLLSQRAEIKELGLRLGKIGLNDSHPDEELQDELTEVVVPQLEKMVIATVADGIVAPMIFAASEGQQNHRSQKHLVPPKRTISQFGHLNS